MQQKPEPRGGTAVVGYYGMSNYGDDAFVHVATWGINRYWNREKIAVVGSPIPGLSAEMFAVPALVPNGLYSGVGLGGRVSRGIFKLPVVFTRSELVYAGGSTLVGVDALEAKRVYALAAARGLVGLAGVGLSVGPFANSKAARDIAGFLRLFKYLAVRDQRSFEIVRRMDLPGQVVRAADLFGLFPKMHPPEAGGAPDSRVLGVALSSISTVADRESDDLCAAVVDTCLDHDLRLRVLVLNSHPEASDGAWAKRLVGHAEASGVRVDTVVSKDGVVPVWKAIAQCDAIFSVRLHGAISAFMAHVPFALVEYHPKCTDFLDDIGQHHDLRLQGNPKGLKNVRTILGHLMEEPTPPKTTPETYSDLAELNFTERAVV